MKMVRRSFLKRVAAVVCLPFVAKTVTVACDLNGKPFVNSRGESFDPTPEEAAMLKHRTFTVAEIERFYRVRLTGVMSKDEIRRLERL